MLREFIYGHSTENVLAAKSQPNSMNNHIVKPRDLDKALAAWMEYVTKH